MSLPLKQLSFDPARNKRNQNIFCCLKEKGNFLFLSFRFLWYHANQTEGENIYVTFTGCHSKVYLDLPLKHLRISKLFGAYVRNRFSLKKIRKLRPDHRDYCHWEFEKYLMIKI
uniref:Uncharacterized protein n=1 Tax=Micrurus lemniscatus lemniscatus TaxID=129467 RepID=A0A2D4JQ39_MICLE